MRRYSSAFVLLVIGLVGSAAGADTPAPDFRPDPLSVRRYGPGYRYPQAGWIVLHIEGEPYDRGYQHGRLLWREIQAYLRCSAQVRGHKAPAEAWDITRILVNALFLRRYDQEYLEEMKGIADGAAAAGAKFEGRPVDLIDIVAMNAWPEVVTLDGALHATPTGLEGKRFKDDQPREMPPEKQEHCSAFAATGPATADGKIVFGHITMFGLYPSLFYNVWIDIKPAKGHRVMMQTFPGGMNSGMDYYMNDAGLLVCETTIAQTRFDIKGKALASRIRNVMQYGDSIDRAVEILKDGNNGLYTNEWLLGDIKTNEIAMFELGTHKSKLYRSSKNEWFGGTEGFYWGCNNAKDLDVRLETVASLRDTPANIVWSPSARDVMWQKLYRENKGKIDVDFGKRAFTTPPVAAYHSLDAKFTTTDLAKAGKTWALYGPPLGKAWQPTHEERQRYPEVRAMVSNPWTVLNTNPPPSKVPGVVVADLDGKVDDAKSASGDNRVERGPVWRGTILPKTDADIWLAAAFSEYERFVREEQTLTPLKSPAKDELVRDDPELKAFNEMFDKTAEETARLGEMGPLEYVFVHILRAMVKGRVQRDLAKQNQKLGQQLAAATLAGKPQLSVDHHRQLGLKLFAHRSGYAAGVRGLDDVSLNEIKPDPSQNDWYKIASGKGVLMLHELRRLMGDDAFVAMMDQFGLDHAGKAASTAEFQVCAEKAAKQPLDQFFAFWLTQPELPVFHLGNVHVERENGDLRVKGEIIREAGPPRIKVDVTIEHAKGETTHNIELTGQRSSFSIDTTEQPKRVVVNKYGLTARTGDANYAVNAYRANLDRTLIVYGTMNDEAAQREAAENLQRHIVQSGSNITVPIKADREIADADLKLTHLLIVGGPNSNKLAQRFRDAFPVRFGDGSFTVDGTLYADAGSAVIAATRGEFDRRYSMILLAGLSAESTWILPDKLLQAGNAEVAIFPARGKPKLMVVPRKEMVKEFD